MPSPVGHALGGIVVGWGVAPRRDLAAAITLSLVAAGPDLDLLIHRHRGPSHSLGAAIIAGLLAWAITRRPRWGVAAALAWGSHVLLDWLGRDAKPPFGIMALWPFSHAHYQSGLAIFPPTSRRYWLGEFWVVNLKALGVELLILAPLAALVVWRYRRQ
jgi:inner membrane protein